jgi:YD repeat-containing protein
MPDSIPSAGTKLDHIDDREGSGLYGQAHDLQDQVSENYGYDEIGNLIKDSSENIPTNGIKWNVYGKITEVNRSAPTDDNKTSQIRYYYDASGNRIGKRVTRFDNTDIAYTWYVRDARGNVMNVYTASKDSTQVDSLPLFDVL